MNWIEILILFFSFQALLLSLLFFLKRENVRANRIFAFFLLLFSYNLFYNVLYWSRIDTRLLIGLLYTYNIPLYLYGGLFFLYIRNVTVNKGLSWKDLLHLLPLTCFLVLYGGYMILPISTKIHAVQTNTYREYIWEFPAVYPISIALMLGYGLVSYFKFVKHYKNDRDLTIWLRVISLVFITFTIAHTIYATLSLLKIIPEGFDYFITFFMILMIGLVGYFAFMHSAIFNGTAIEKVIPFVKYKRTGLSKEFSLELKEKLLTIMDKEKPYCNPDIRLNDLADLLDISRHHASQVINEHFSISFFDFINGYRIREAERLLLSKKSNLSITDIAFMSGFNNRVSFYKAFKKIEGTTPSAYRDHYLAS